MSQDKTGNLFMRLERILCPSLTKSLPGKADLFRTL